MSKFFLKIDIFYKLFSIALMKICFNASEDSNNLEASARLSARYGAHSQEECDVIVALGGDGHMLTVLHAAYLLNKPVYGMNGGSLGFLMNAFDEENLDLRLRDAAPQILYPIRGSATLCNGDKKTVSAFNEIVLLRATRQAAKIAVKADGVLRLSELVCDGVMVATPAGSTAYNLSVSGPVLPIGSNVLALTPISPFRPRRWRGAITPAGTLFEFETLEREKRPVNLTADHISLRDVASVIVRQDTEKSVSLLFDKNHPLPERVIAEQFAE